MKCATPEWVARCIVGSGLTFGPVSIVYGAEFIPIAMDTPSTAYDVSADGMVVVGAGGDGGMGFQWTQTNGAVSLGDLPGGGVDTQGLGVDPTGAIVVGIASSSVANQQAMSWSVLTGVVGLDIGSNGSGSARGATAGGSLIVGTSEGEAVMWTDTGMMIIPSAHDSASAQAVTPDGQSILIQGSMDGLSSLSVWRPGSGETPLTGTIGSQQIGNRMTPDGLMVLGAAGFGGEGVFPDYWQWFRWTEPTGMVSLPLLSGFEGGVIGTDLTEDGTVVVGRAIFSRSSSNSRAVIWDVDHGVRFIQDVLVEDYAIDLTGWTLRSAWGISEDGKVIVGSGLDPQNNRRGWIAILTSDVVGDFNDSGQVEQGDLDLVLQNWGHDVESNGVPTGWFNDRPVGLVDQSELDRVLQNWGNIALPNYEGSLVPEPQTLTILIGMIATVFSYRKHSIFCA